jgi:tetratricopeptide (TPR) repeat protein
LNPHLDDQVDRVLRQLESGAGKAVEPKIRNLLEKHPFYHMTNYAMGIYLGMVAKNPEGALPFFKKAVEIFPPFPEAHFNLGFAAMKTCDVPKAVAGFRAAMRYSHNGDGIAEKAREQLQFLEKNLLKGTAFKNLDAYLANSKLFDAAFQCLANFQFDQAVKMFKGVAEAFPNHVQSYGNLALAYAGLGRKAMAMQCLEKALALDPSYEPARANRCVLDAMREGEPFIPGGIREVNYYADRLRDRKDGVQS